MTLLFAKRRPVRGACWLEAIEGVPRTYELDRGVSRASDWPSDACFRMSPELPDDVGLVDFLPNVGSCIVASAAVRALLEAEKVRNVEYLPVSIINHKGRKQPEPYFVVNPFPLQDCIDMERTVGTRNEIDRSLLAEVDHLVIDESRIDPSVMLFRMKHWPYRDVYRPELAEKIKAAKFTGIKFVTPEEGLSSL
ncbi:MAG TPA: DUF1629 domain-containing protein [Anaeromyxobacter sp.]|nr:DUF1629 domain-containing protein [Anaeromyxobacter sp.]